jgi:Na+/proline symporter
MRWLHLDAPVRAQVSLTEELQGLVMPAASYVLLGKGGAVLVIVICFMAVTSSGASEMVAVSSLFTFDIYRRYIHPQVSTPSYDRVTLGTYSSVETCL